MPKRKTPSQIKGKKKGSKETLIDLYRNGKIARSKPTTRNHGGYPV